MVKELESYLINVVPILRGCIAELTDNEDDPYQRSIMTVHANSEARDYVKSEKHAGNDCPVELNGFQLPPMKLDDLPEGTQTEALKEKIAKSVDEYIGFHNHSPQVFFCPDVGIITARCHVPHADKGQVLNNKVALVTGSAGAIGAGICEALLEKGCKVVATDLAGEKLEGLVGELKKRYSGEIEGIPMDVTSERSVKQAFKEVVWKWGGVDIVIINAGIAMVSSLVEMDFEAFRELEKVNVEGALLVLSEAGRYLIRQGLGGDIVLISTKNVLAPGAQFGAYSATKAAAHQLCRIASLEFAPEKIRVNMVAPDAIFAHGERKSGLWEKIGPDRMKKRGLDEKGLEEYYQSRNLLQAKITANHVANAVLFFVTRQTPTTGATLPVDGGLPDAAPR